MGCGVRFRHRGGGWGGVGACVWNGEVGGGGIRGRGRVGCGCDVVIFEGVGARIIGKGGLCGKVF